jgi:uncharacterized protein (TIGR03086 family)
MERHDPAALFASAATTFGELVHAVGDDQWSAPTPCADWDVRQLVNHLTVEDLWAVPIFEGETIASVGSAFDGDQLGEAPMTRWDDAVAGAVAAVTAPGAMDRIVHLSFGDLPGSEYTMQLFADHLVHAWDLATALGRDPHVDASVVAACRAWFVDNEAGYRAAGVIGPRQPVADDADDLAWLVAAFGRTA